MFRTERLVATICQFLCRIFQAIGVLTAGPAIEVAHVRAETGLVLDRNVLQAWVQSQFTVIGRDVGTVALAVEQVTIRLAAWPNTGADRR